MLDRRYAPLRKQDKYIDHLPPFEGFQRSRACIPAGGAQNNRMAVLAAKGAIKRPGQKLHRIIFKGDGRAIKQLQKMDILLHGF